MADCDALEYLRCLHADLYGVTWDATWRFDSTGLGSPTVAGRSTGHSCFPMAAALPTGLDGAPRGAQLLPVVAQDRSAGRQAPEELGSLVSTFGQMRVLVRWMVGEGYIALSTRRRRRNSAF